MAEVMAKGVNFLYAKRFIGRALVPASSPLRRGASFSQFLIDKVHNHSYI